MFVATGQVAETLHDQAADGVELVVGKFGIEVFVEVLDRRQRADGVGAVAHVANVLFLVGVMLVLDIADDLLEDVLDGDDTGCAAVLVDHDRHVIVGVAELLEQAVETFGLGNEHRRAQHIAQLERLALLGIALQQRQQILDQQNADDVIEVVVDDRIAGVRGFQDDRQAIFRALGHGYRGDLGARDHYLAHLLVADLEGAFDDGQRILVEVQPRAGFAQEGEQLFAGAGFIEIAREGTDEFIQPGSTVLATRSVFAHDCGLLSSDDARKGKTMARRHDARARGRTALDGGSITACVESMIDVQRGPSAIRERLGGGSSGCSAVRLGVSLDPSRPSVQAGQEGLVGVGMMMDVGVVGRRLDIGFRIDDTIGVRDAKLGEQGSFQGFHLLGFLIIYMVMTEQMQATVYYQMGVVRLDRLVLFLRFAHHDVVADHQVAEQGKLDSGRRLEGKGEHVGRLVLAAIVAIELLALVSLDEADRQFVTAIAFPVEHRTDPGFQLRLCRKCGFGLGADGNLTVDLGTHDSP